MNASTPYAVRRSLLTSLPKDPYQISEPDPRFVYVPQRHIRALDPDNMLVVGARGTGKSFWWKALLADGPRAVIREQTSSMQQGKLVVSAGWAETELAAFPNKEVLGALRSEGHAPRTIWKTVLLAQVAGQLFEEFKLPRWKNRVAWVRDNPEDVAIALRASDARLVGENARHLVIFDALDRTADSWGERQALLRGLLELVLDVRSLRAIRAKVFLRDDMIQDTAVTSFPDASKVVAARVELSWPRLDLYGLLWQYMGNADEGADVFRRLVSGWRMSGGGPADAAAPHVMPDTLKRDEHVQRTLFARIAGTRMGTNERRGLPYTWIPTHLGDANGVATPRSFIAALRTAVDETPEAWTYAVHWRGIQSGVNKASEYRVGELVEDFPWTQPAMQGLEGATVPCERADIVNRWNFARTLIAIDGLPESRRNRRAALGVAGLLEDLREIGVLEVRLDRRFNIPDVYRVGFGLRRKGGVRPVR